MKKVLNLLTLFFTLGVMYGQSGADPAVTGALFNPTVINVGSQSVLTVSFSNTASSAIPANSIELNVSVPNTYYTISNASPPTGPGASFFTWTLISSNTWRGTSNSSVPGFGGGDIFVNVTGATASPSFQTTNVNVQVTANFSQFNDNTSNNNLQPQLDVDPALVACATPTPRILGDFFGCRNSQITINVDTVTTGNTYLYTLVGNTPAQIVSQSNGTAFIQLPDIASGSFNIILTETTTGGCTGVAAAVLTIESNSSLICDDNVYISLDSNCMIRVTPDIILEGQSYPDASYQMTITDAVGKPISNPIIGRNLLNQALTVSIKHLCSGNSCWGKITLEDKQPPKITCPDPITISCFSTQSFNIPNAKDNCDNNVLVRETSNILDDLACGADYAAIRTITYTAVDDFNNVSATCTRTIYYQYEDINDIVFPENLDVPGKLLVCDSIDIWDRNKNNYPDPAETGFPTLNGNVLQVNNGLCKINSIFQDQRIDICANSYKILRTWTILDWCTGEIITSAQIIKVLDNKGPVVSCPTDFDAKVYTDPYTCTASYNVPDPIVIYDCGKTTYTVGYLLADVNGAPPINGKYITDNVKIVNGKYVITNLPKGLTWIRYIITDECGNSSPCFTEVFVEDNIPPVAVCDKNTVVSLNNTGVAQIFAETFDDGSLDNCGKVGFEVARESNPCNSISGFNEAAYFCCQDVGKELRVTLRVWDDANCNGIIGDEINLYSDTNGDGIFGNVVNGVADRLIRRVSDKSNTCDVFVRVQDKTIPIATCPKDVTIDCEGDTSIVARGMATAVDNCEVTLVSVRTTGTLNNCQEGLLTRRWTFTDKTNTAFCEQKIRVDNLSPFTANNINWLTVPNRTLNGCIDHDLRPEVLGKPTWSNDNCSLIAASYEDQTFQFVDSVCTKILRRWTVIDWCTYDAAISTTIGKYEYIQVIKINNLVKPNFVSCADVTVCIEGQNCKGNIEVLHPATDDCTKPEDLKYNYTIDFGNNGSVDFTGKTNKISGEYSPGKNKVNITVEDGCGNEQNCSYILTVKDCKKPTPYCLSELVTVIMNDPIKKEVSIWANDFDHGSFDNCAGPLKFSFSANTLDTGRVFGCSSLGVNDLEMWVTDVAGNKDYCKVSINIQDNGICPGSVVITGIVEDERKTPIKGATVKALSLELNIANVGSTDATGAYKVGVNNTNTYKTFVTKNDDILNGVSTLDLVLIQRHILGVAKLNSPYKLIAADVNNTKSISAADLVALRKVILGVSTSFPNNDSWRFPVKDQEFGDEKSPWTFLENVNWNKDSETTEFDFTGVKIGDVNSSVNLNVTGYVSEPRSNNKLQLEADNIEYTSGQEVRMVIRSKDVYALYGLQNTMNFDESKLTFVGVEQGILNVSNENIGLSNVDRGTLTLSWGESKSITLNKGEVLYTLVFRAKDESTLAAGTKLSSDITAAEAYDENMDIQKISLDFRTLEISNEFSVGQNSPNPFKDITTIPFFIGKADEVSLKVYDITGRLVVSKKSKFEAGNQQFTINGGEILGKGIYTYTVESSLGVASKNMVVID